MEVFRSRPDYRPPPPRQGDIWWSAAPPANTNDPAEPGGFSAEQLAEWLSCTTGWEAVELSWGALASCGVASARQLRPLLQAALAEGAGRGVSRLAVRQLDLDETVGRWLVGSALGAFPNITTLHLAELNLYDEAMGHLCGALHRSECLAALVLESVWASEGGWGALAAAVKVNTSLRTLSLRDCLRGPALPALASCLAAAPRLGSLLEVLGLGRNEALGDAGVEALCGALCQGAAAPAPAPSGGGLGLGIGAVGLGLGLALGGVIGLGPVPTSTSGPGPGPGSGSCLAELDLSQCGAGRRCVAALAALMRHPGLRRLRRLDVGHNHLGAEGARELCAALASAPHHHLHLRCLRLAATGAGDAAAEALARCVAAQASMGGSAGGGLAELDLSHNRVGGRGAAALAAAAQRPGCPLVDLDLAGNGQVGEAGARAWAAALAAPPPGVCLLRRLELSGCEVPDAGAFALGSALKANTALEELGLAENHITTKGLALLAQVLTRGGGANRSLRRLDVSHNLVGPQGAAPMRALLRPPAGRDGASGGGGGPQPGSAGGAGPPLRCEVRCELLPEYVRVEAVKHSREPWGAERRALTAHAQAQAHAAWSGAQAGPDEAGANPFGPLPLEVYVNPFLSPAESYVNPFLDPPPDLGPASPSGYRNPFLELGSPSGANPFLSLQPSGAAPAEAATGAAAAPLPPPPPHDNPFLSPPRGARQVTPEGDPAADVVGNGGCSEGEAGRKGGAAAAGVAGRELAVRVLCKRGPGGSPAAPGEHRASGGGSAADSSGGDGSDDGGNGGSGSGGSCVYGSVSSRCTADEADLVTEQDLDMVELMLRSMGAPGPAGGATEEAGAGAVHQRLAVSGTPEAAPHLAAAAAAAAAARGDSAPAGGAARELQPPAADASAWGTPRGDVCGGAAGEQDRGGAACARGQLPEEHAGAGPQAPCEPANPFVAAELHLAEMDDGGDAQDGPRPPGHNPFATADSHNPFA